MSGKQGKSAQAKLAVVIMAAGKGTRLKSQRPKVLHQVGGKPLLEHVIAAAAGLWMPDDIFVVIGHEAERVRAAVADTGVQFVEQASSAGRATRSSARARRLPNTRMSWCSQAMCR